MHKYSLYLLRDGEPPRALCVSDAGDVIDCIIDHEKQAAREEKDTAVVPVTLTYRHEYAAVEIDGDDLDETARGVD